MLAPRDRQTLLAALRPPEGFRVDSVVATTFTLDLTALLVAPLAFSLLDITADDGNVAGSNGAERELDPYALLRAAREHAENMVVFCDATRIACPTKYRPLFVYLEQCVAQVCAPDEKGVFHPKIWLLRFIGADEAVRYRFLCASRNLTFDQSWDTLLVLEGELTDRVNAIAMNRPLSEFIEHLPNLVRPKGGLSKARSKLVTRMADEVLRVRFELPSGVDAMAFHPLGIPGYEEFERPERVQRALLVSPFVDAGGLKPWSGRGKDHVLVSRVDQLDAQGDDALSGFTSVYALAEALDGDEGDVSSTEPADAETPPTGLHAKLYVVDDGWDAHVWTGSANATSAGFSRNVEILVQLTGKKSQLGVQRFLDAGLSEMTQPYWRSGPGVSEIERQLEEKLCALRRQLAEARWTATVGGKSTAGYPLSLRCEELRLPAAETFRVRPITLPETRTQVVSSGEPVADFGCCSLEALTSFFAFTIALEEQGVRLKADFVLKAQLQGAPADREDQVLASQFTDPSQVMRFVSLLLAEDPAEWLASEEERASRGAAVTGGGVFGGALLEQLLRALHARPEQLDSVDQFIRALAQTDAGRLLVHQEFRQLWEPIYAARQATGVVTR
ncbi:MAG: phospholipase D family protein [Polyangiaceae bacterium]